VSYSYQEHLRTKEQVMQERDANNLPVVTYTRGVDLSGSLQGAGGIGGLLARTDMGRLTVNDPLASAYYHADGNGNITALVTDLMDTNQVLVAKYLYDSYGNLLAESGPLASANKYRFSSKEWDSQAGLYYYGFRFYDPNWQRWLNRDPAQDANLFEWLSAYLLGISIGSSISQGVSATSFSNLQSFFGSPARPRSESSPTACARCGCCARNRSNPPDE
jgi:RHS repeat-associated protein